MDLSRHKKGDGNDDLESMEAPDTGKQEHGKEEHNRSNIHSHHHNHHNRSEENVKGMGTDLVDYVDLDAQSVAGAFLEKKYLALTGKKYDKVERLISPEQIAKQRKEEEEGREKNKGVIYEF